MKEAFDLTGRTAVVTGGAGLIGRGLVEGLGGCGAHVFIAEVDLAAAEAVAEPLRRSGMQVSSVVLDICDVASIEACVAEVVSRAGRLDVWVNSAYPKTPGAAADLEQVPVDVWNCGSRLFRPITISVGNLSLTPSTWAAGTTMTARSTASGMSPTVR